MPPCFSLELPLAAVLILMLPSISYQDYKVAAFTCNLLNQCHPAGNKLAAHSASLRVLSPLLLHGHIAPFCDIRTSTLLTCTWVINHDYRCRDCAIESCCRDEVNGAQVNALYLKYVCLVSYSLCSTPG